MSKKPKPKGAPMSPYFYHEALDRSYTLMNSVSTQLLEHPAISENPAAKEAAEDAIDRLADVYTLMGNYEFENDEQLKKAKKKKGKKT